MILTNNQIVELYEIIQLLKQIEFPIKTSFVLIKNLKVLEPYYQAVQETRNEVLKRFGFDGSPDFKFPEEKVIEINKELFEILEMESEIAVSQIWMADLEKYLPQATPALLEALYPIISEEEI